MILVTDVVKTHTKLKTIIWPELYKVADFNRPLCMEFLPWSFIHS